MVATPAASVIHVKGASPDAVYIGRYNWMHNLPKSKWANPFKIGKDGDRDEVIAKFRRYLIGNDELMSALPELRGKTLACWCKPAPCHGDVLAQMVNELLP